MRCEISQKAMSLLRERALEAPADGLGKDEEDGQAGHDRHLPGRPEAAIASTTKARHAMKSADDPEPRPVREAHQRIGRRASPGRAPGPS